MFYNFVIRYSVERAKREIKNALGSKMRENCNDLCWVKYLSRVQFEKNTTYHSTIRITPFEALFNHKTSFGLSDLGIPSEIASDIHMEQDLECIINEINAAAPDQEVIQGDSTNSGSLFLVPSQSYPAYLSPDSDPYLEDISHLILDETHVFEPTSSLSTYHSLACAVCGELTSGIHSCPGCRRSVHTMW